MTSAFAQQKDGTYNYLNMTSSSRVAALGGTIVPIYFINKYYKDYKLVHITYSMLDDIELYKFGMAIQKTAKNLNKNIVIIASGDLSHKLKEDGPYNYSPQGPKFDRELIENLKS